MHWNVSNPIFRIDNTEHVMDVMLQDQVHIVCPKWNSDEQYIIYNVNKEDYDNCRITDPNPTTVAVCNSPDRDMIYTITFRSFSPSPTMLEFQPGKDYYFISTSSPKNLHQRSGGTCVTNNMKVIFKVREKLEETNSVLDSKFRWMNRKINGRRREQHSDRVSSGENTRPKPYYPTSKTFQSRSYFPHQKPLKNPEVVKQEASRMHSAAHRHLPSFAAVLIGLVSLRLRA